MLQILGRIDLLGVSGPGVLIAAALLRSCVNGNTARDCWPILTRIRARERPKPSFEAQLPSLSRNILRRRAMEDMADVLQRVNLKDTQSRLKILDEIVFAERWEDERGGKASRSEHDQAVHAVYRSPTAGASPGQAPGSGNQS